MSSIQGNFMRVAAIPFQFIDERALVLTPDNQMAHELNESATLIFKLLETPKSFEDICTELTQYYESEQVWAHQRQIQDTLMEMLQKNILMRQ